MTPIVFSVQAQFPHQAGFADFCELYRSYEEYAVIDISIPGHGLMRGRVDSYTGRIERDGPVMFDVIFQPL